MNIELFIKQMNTEHKESVIEKHITRQYVPLEEKIAHAKKIIEICCYKDMIDAEGKTQKMFWVDSVTQHFLTIRSIIEMYTDLTFSDNPTKDYNMLAEKKYDEMIFNALPQDDVQEFMNIVDMVYDDEYENVNSIQGRIKNLLFGFDNIFKSALESLSLEQIDGGDNNGEYHVESGLDS